MKKSMPKIELHVHLDGSIPRETFKLLAAKAGIALPEDETELTKMLEVTDECTSLEDALEKFALPLSVLISEEAFETAVYDLMRQAAGEGVKYMEIRFAPRLSETDYLSMETIIEACLKGINRAEQDFDIKGNLLLCIMRTEKEEDNLVLVDLAAKYHNKGVAGLDLAGAEIGHPCTDFEKIWAAAKAKNIPYTIHAGETGDPASIWQAVRQGARRIGHGVCMDSDPELRKYVKEHAIGIEMCPTSNLQTHAVDALENYPLKQYLAEGIIVSVNTDNRTVSSTTLNRELQLLEDAGQISEAQQLDAMEACIDVIFADDTTKDWLREKFAAYRKEA